MNSPTFSPESPGADIDVWAARGFSSEGVACDAKVSALSAAVMPAAEPLPTVSYVSKGNVLVIGDGPLAARAATELARALPVTLLVSSKPAGLDAAPESLAVWQGKVDGASGYLGQFTLALAGLTGLRGLAPTAPGGAAPQSAIVDLVVDAGREPLFAQHQPPQGYWRLADDAALEKVLAEVPQAVGEFEKPKFFAYRAKLCAHSRSAITGCNRCVEVCSTRAIAAEGDHVKVDPHLCMGCGACASVCPSGAMSFQFPRVADRGDHLRSLLSAFRAASGEDACVLFHNGTDGRALLASAAAAGHGLPARVIPIEAWHVASVGVDLFLGAMALGANQVVVLAAGSEAPEYRVSLSEQLALAQQIVTALGYAGQHFKLVEASDAQSLAASLVGMAAATGPAAPAAFALSNDKRMAVEFAVEHLAKHAPRTMEQIALASGAPWGEVKVDKEKCTLCLACAGACPASALMDGGEAPQLRFLERNCVQCGLCVKTCPEKALALSPRLLLTPAVREARVINETQPFHCVRCSKPFGTKQMVDAMVGRLSGHSMFSGGAALQRLQMCADCRVVDMMSNPNEMTTRDL